MSIEDYRNYPRHYVIQEAEDGATNWETIARAALYHLDGDQLRDVADDCCPPNFECAGCDDLFHLDDLGHESEDDYRMYCHSCVSEGKHKDGDEDEDQCSELNCDDELDEEGNCPTCSKDPEY